MEEEIREQPDAEPAKALNAAEENSVVSEDGSQEIFLGKFKNVQALLDAYNNLQTEFTKKCQLLSSIQQDKMKENIEKNSQNEERSEEKSEVNTENDLISFLKDNEMAETFREELQSRINEKQSPYEKAWASIVLSHVKNDDKKTDDPIINQYILKDEKLKNKIIEIYLNELNSAKPPVMMSSQGERVSTVTEAAPVNLAEAKERVKKMFS